LQYAESIPHFRESLAINSLQVTLWFNLGYAALHEEDWSLCATAYQRYCSLDPEVLSCEPIDSATDFADPLGNPKRSSTVVKKQYENYHLVHSLNICNEALINNHGFLLFLSTSPCGLRYARILRLLIQVTKIYASAAYSWGPVIMICLSERL